MELVGRYQEKAQIRRALGSDKSELIAIYGRRRVGKTYFISQLLAKEITFELTGIYSGNVPDHMTKFAKALTKYSRANLPLEEPRDWFKAFDMLEDMIGASRSRRKKVIFLDELPWMATHKSRFLSAFTSFWNEWAARRKDIVIIICGSAASWMIQKILKNKGGLHNRVTDKIIIEPFDLQETEVFLKNKGIVLDRYAISQLYMVMGGIPHYLDQLQPGESADQAIDRLCFSKKGLLRSEYQELYESLYGDATTHLSVIEALAGHPRGLTRAKLITHLAQASGGGLTKIIDELTASGFITVYIPYGKKKKDAIYKLTDPYTLFYLKYIRSQKQGDQNNWLKIARSPTWTSWSGLAFENLCMAHVSQIKMALGISKIQTSVSSWHHRGNDEMPGAQIDLLIKRADRIINICEMKYSTLPYTITKEYAAKLRRKIASFQHFEKIREVFFPTIITTYELIPNVHSSFIQNVVVLDQLFTKDESKYP